MKNIITEVIVVVIVLLSCSALQGQNELALTTLNEIIKHAENNSLYRNNVDWSSLKTKMHEMAKEAETVEALKPALDLMFRSLNDTHGRVFHNNRYLSYYLGESDEHSANLDSDIYNDIQTGSVYPFQAELLEEKVGYVRIVGLPMGDNEAMSMEIQDAVCEVMNEGVTKWIIDLRFNGGGNMFPMVEGVTSIIGDGIVGGTKGVTADEHSIWRIEEGDFYYDDYTVGLSKTCGIEGDSKVAVLLSGYTASSGEALAVILRNRPNSRFFGSRSNGKVTATDWNQVSDLTAMSISVSVYVDRTGKVYDEYVDVDEAIDFDPHASKSEDKAVIRAMEWLKE
jgi:hypothetical protein